ncbi:MAG: hypothetical protein R8G66_28670 [Cytophagales bacterium]|nr:hypothetical protein [Cytophagales bacterium]
MNRLVRFLLLLLLAFALISLVKAFAVSRLLIMGTLFVLLIGIIIWVMNKANKNP